MHIYNHASGILNYSMCYITFIYTVKRLRSWPLSIVSNVLVGQSLMCALYIHHIFSQTTMHMVSLQYSLCVNLCIPLAFS